MILLCNAVSSTSALLELFIKILAWLLQGRMSDTNRNLTAKTLLLLGEMAKAMGPAFESVGRPLLSVSVSNLSDSKSQVC